MDDQAGPLPHDLQQPPPQVWMPRAEFERIFGPQLSWTPAEARDVLAGLGSPGGLDGPGGRDGLGVPWWVAGGWAIEAFTGVAREHEDIDLSVFRRDLPAVRRHLESDWHLWAVSEQGLVHLAPGREMPDHAEQVRVREHALAPWRGELVLNPDLDRRWQFKRDASVVLPLEEATWARDGIRYLRPELVLAHKVSNTRPKDDADLRSALPLLDAAQRDWLSGFVTRHAPAHPWRQLL